MALIRIDEVVFEWDDLKAERNLHKHGVTFEESATAFKDELGRSKRDTVHSVDEDRFVLIGRSEAGRILTVIFVERGDRLRLISAREATPRERRERERRNKEGSMGR